VTIPFLQCKAAVQIPICYSGSCTQPVSTRGSQRASRANLHNTHNILGGRSGPSAVQVS